MDATVKNDIDDGMEKLTSFRIQVCSNNGRVLEEYTLSRSGDNVATLDAAEDRVREGLADYQGEPLAIFVSQETLTKFHQLQITVNARRPCAA